MRGSWLNTSQGSAEQFGRAKIDLEQNKLLYNFYVLPDDRKRLLFAKAFSCEPRTF